MCNLVFEEAVIKCRSRWAVGDDNYVDEMGIRCIRRLNNWLQGSREDVNHVCSGEGDTLCKYRD